MLDHKKTRAFLISLLVSAVSAAAPMSMTYAENEVETSSQAEEAENEENDDSESEEDDDDEDDEPKIYEAENFDYKLDENDNAIIVMCRSAETVLDVPSELDGHKVVELGTSAFGKTDGEPFKVINIPETVEYISSYNPFVVCDSLEEINVAPENKNYMSENGLIYSKDKTKLISYPQKKAGTSFTVPDGVKEIGANAFYNSQISEITIPATVEEIGGFCFGHCSSLKKADLSGLKLKELQMYLFAYCDNLTEVLLPESLEEIGGAAFAGCTSLEKIDLTKNIYRVSQYAFANTGLKKIVVPSSVEDIGYCAFGYTVTESGQENPDPSFIIVGETGSVAQQYASDSDSEYDYNNDFIFRTYEEDEDLSELEGLEKYTFESFQYAVIDGEVMIIGCIDETKSVTVPAEIDGKPVTTIYSSAFSYTGAETIELPESVKSLRKLAFYGCENLKTLKLPQSLEEIGDNAFDGCKALEELDLGGATVIGEQLINNCDSLRVITISGDCTSIANDAENPFTYCTSLEAINITDGDGKYASEDGVLFNKDKSVLLHYPASKSDKKYKAPKSVKEIASLSFTEAKNIEELDISSAEKIGDYSFAYCKKLKKAELSKDLEKIGSFAFFNCDSLTSLRFYGKLKTVGEYAFGFKDNPEIKDDEEAKPLLEDDFKIYADKETAAYSFAKDNDIKVVEGTIKIFGLNLNKKLVVLVVGGVSAVIAVTVLGFIMKAFKKKKKSSKPKDNENGGETASDDETSEEKTDNEEKENEENDKENA